MPARASCIIAQRTQVPGKGRYRRQQGKSQAVRQIHDGRESDVDLAAAAVPFVISAPRASLPRRPDPSALLPAQLRTNRVRCDGRARRLGR
jgi:hypothetical protein